MSDQMPTIPEEKAKEQIIIWIQFPDKWLSSSDVLRTEVAKACGWTLDELKQFVAEKRKAGCRYGIECQKPSCFAPAAHDHVARHGGPDRAAQSSDARGPAHLPGGFIGDPREAEDGQDDLGS